MNPITRIDRKEAARYLGFRGMDWDQFTDALLDECEWLLLKTAAPKYTYRLLPLEQEADGLTPAGTALRLTGRDISRHLAGCSHALLLCATLGPEADGLVRRLEIRDMAKAMVTDSLCNAMIEQVCDLAEEEIKAGLSFAGYTGRFSPGYGDLPLEIQPEFLNTLDAGRRIGVQLSSKLLLTPLKTVTAVIGCANHPVSYSAGGCGSCAKAASCALRKEGKTCGIS